MSRGVNGLWVIIGPPGLREKIDSLGGRFSERSLLILLREDLVNFPKTRARMEFHCDAHERCMGHLIQIGKGVIRMDYSNVIFSLRDLRRGNPSDLRYIGYK